MPCSPTCTAGFVVEIIDDGLARVCLNEHSTTRTGRVAVSGTLSLPQLPAADFERMTVPGHGALASQSETHRLPILPIQGPSCTQREAQPSRRSLDMVAFGHPVLDAFQPLQVAASRAVTCANRTELNRHLLLGALATLAEAQSASPVHVVFVSVGGSTGQHNATMNTLSAASKRVTHVSAPSGAPLGQRYLAPFTGLAVAQELARQGRKSVLIISDLTAHADAARQVAGVSWADMMAAPTNTGALFDAACMVKHGGSVTVVAGAVGTPSGGPGIPHTGSGSSEAGAAGRGQGMLADRSVNPSSISAQDTKGQEWLDQVVSLASSSYHLYGNSAADASVGHLPVPDEVLTWANGHKAQGSAMCTAAGSTLQLLRELRATATQTCTALEYGIAPEADQDRKLAYYAKAQLLLNPTADLLEAMASERCGTSEVRLGLVAAGASDQALAFFESTQEAARGKAEPIGNFPDPKQLKAAQQAGQESAKKSPSSVPWLKVDRESWLSKIPGFGAGKRSLHTVPSAVFSRIHAASMSSKSGDTDGSSVLDKFASKMSPEQLQALKAAQAKKRKPRTTSSTKPVAAKQSTQPDAVTPKRTVSGSTPSMSNAASEDQSGLMGNAEAATDDFDDLIAALERGGATHDTQESAMVSSDETDDEPLQAPGTPTAVKEGGATAHAAMAEIPPFEQPALANKDEPAVPHIKNASLATISVDRTFLRLLLISSGVLSTIPTHQVLAFEQMVFDVVSNITVRTAAKLCKIDPPQDVNLGATLLAFSRHELLHSDAHLVGDMASVLLRSRVAPWQLEGADQSNANLINYVTFACRSIFLE